MTLASEAIPNSASKSAAAFMVGQSESLPIKMPTTGFDFLERIGFNRRGRLWVSGADIVNVVRGPRFQAPAS
jgi:hypothetical protein